MFDIYESTIINFTIHVTSKEKERGEKVKLCFASCT